MRKAKIQIIYPEIFDVDQEVEFKVSVYKKKFRIFNGVIKTGYKCYYINFSEHYNDVIFRYLNIDKELFCCEFLNMENIRGDWPEVSSLAELRHMLETLEHLNEF